MNRRELLRSTAAAVALAHFPWAVSRAADAPKRKLLFFTKSGGYEHSVVRRKRGELSHAERVLTELGKDHGFEVVATKDGGVFDGDLAQFDAFVFYTTGDLTTVGTDKQPAMTAEGKQRLLDAVASGKGFVGSHCASDTFHRGEPFERQTDVDPYIAMVGGEFISHGPQQPARQVIFDARFPGFDKAHDEGSGDSFRLTEEWYSLKNFADDLHVILAQDTQGMKGSDYDRPPFPSTWARRHDKGRVFYTSMGHREDVWTNPKFQAMFLGGIAWACGDAQADVAPNLRNVTPGADVMPKRR